MTSSFSRRAPAFCALPLLAAALSGSGCRSREADFDLSRARGHVDVLAGTIGTRPTGSPANVRAREYLVDELRNHGFTVRVQEADAVDTRAGVTARVANIIAVRDGALQDAIALVAHYDSVPEGPGAVDDALGVATCLEAARVLSQAPMRHSLFVLLTDGEELGLMGARAIVKDPQVAARLKSFLNFDGPAGGGTPILFEASPGWGAPLDAWARSGAPTGASFAVEIYKRLPNDTDFTVLNAKASGLNFAPLIDAYAYHTDRDVSRRVDTFTLRRLIENAIDIVRTLDTRNGAPRGDSPTYFDIADRYAVVYGSTTTRVVAWTAAFAAAVAWLLLTTVLWRLRGWAGLLLAVLWSLLTTLAAIAAPIGVTWLLRAVRQELNPWYAVPLPYFGLLLASGCAAVWLVGRLAASVPERMRPVGTSAATWWVALPVWTALALMIQRSAPAASFLFSVPLVVAAVLLVLVRRSAALVRAASLVVLVVVVLLWVEKTNTILALLVPLSGWLGVVMPVWVYPAVIGAAAVMFGPPLAAAVVGWHPPFGGHRLIGGVLLGWLALAAAFAFVSPAYTADRPQRRGVRYVQDDIGRQAWWEVMGNERTLDIDARGVPGADWQRATGGPPTSVRVAPIGRPFQFRTTTSPLATIPADVRSTISGPPGGRRVVEISIVPHDNMTARVVLPGGPVPVESSLAGRVANNEWSATYVSPPASGLSVRLTLDNPSTEVLRHLAVVLTVRAVPGGGGVLNLPPWLSGERAAWQVRSIYIVSAAPAGL